MTTITGSAPHTPDLFMLYSTEQASRSILDYLLDGTLVVQPRAAALRRGQLQALFIEDEAAAEALRADIASGGVLTVSGSERSSLDLDFILDGTVRVELDDTTREDFIVTWDFQEVL